MSLPNLQIWIDIDNKGCEIMLELDDIIPKLKALKERIEELGESL